MITNSYPAAQCRQEFIHAMEQAGIEFQGDLEADGQMHKFASGSSPYKDGYYVFSGASGSFGDIGHNIHRRWKMPSGELTRIGNILPQPARPEKRLVAVTAGQLLSMEVPPREMILGPIIPEQGLAMIHAPRGIGKTHVSLMIGRCVATGGTMFGRKWTSEKPHKVLFVEGEMSLSAIQERLGKLVSSEEKGLVDENLLFITPDMQTKCIPDLTMPEGQQAIEEHLEGIKLIILDNHSSLCRLGRENESESWVPVQEWFLKLRKQGISVLLIHHSNKNGGQRGTSRKEDLLDTVITLRKPDDYKPREGARFQVHYEKARGFCGEEATPFEASLAEEDGKFIWQVQAVDEDVLSKVLELKKTGMTQREIAQETGLSLSTTNRRLKEFEDHTHRYN